MQKFIYKYLRRGLPFLVWGIPLAYLFIALIPIPGSISTGIDPSWQYAISRASANGLIFGRDIVFTYGPVGYLIHGVAYNKNIFYSIFGFRVLVHLSIFIIAVIKIITLPKNWQKIFFIVSLLVAYIASFIEQHLLFIFIILLSSEFLENKKFIRWWSLGLGAVAGFCLGAKFTIGILTIGSLVLLLSTKIYSSIRKKENIKVILLALIDSLAAAFAVLFILLEGNHLLSFKKILLCLILSGFFAFFTEWLTKKLLNKKSFTSNVAEEGNKKIESIISLFKYLQGWYGFYLIYLVAFILTIFVFSHPLIEYLKGSLEISSGFSSAMSLVGSNWELGLGISEIVLIAALLVLMAREHSLGLAIYLAFTLWITFKQGFVRQDGHVLNFLVSTPIIAALCITKFKEIRPIKWSIFTNVYVLIVLLIYCYSPVSYGNLVVTQQLKRLSFDSVVSQVSALLNLPKFQESINSVSQQSLSQLKLPDRVREVVKDKTIDIVPWEISLAEANQLNWKPRPIFQSYSAYTLYLDNLNLKNLSTNPRDYIFYNFLAIDGRHPFFDEPATFFHILCNYKISDAIPEFITTPNLPKIMLLERMNSSRCSSGTVSQKISFNWKSSQSIDTSDELLVRASVKFHYSIFGKLYKTLFRSPPLIMYVTDVNGIKHKYRVIPETSENGIIVSHLPQDDQEAFSLFKGELPVRVKSFKFSTSNPLLYKSKIESTLTLYKILYTPPKKSKFVGDISQLKNINFFSIRPDEYLGVMDSKQSDSNQYFKRGDVISAFGWATKKAKGEKYWVLLTYGANNRPIALAQTGISRPDVAQFFKNSKYSNSGWLVNFSSELMPKGIHDLKAWIYEPNSNGATPLTGTYRVEIR